MGYRHSYTHTITPAEAASLARELAVDEAIVREALDRQGLLAQPDPGVPDVLRVLSDVLITHGTSNEGGEMFRDDGARLCVIAGHLLKRIVPDVADAFDAAGIDYDAEE